jgi:hypothetical protein
VQRQAGVDAFALTPAAGACACGGGCPRCLSTAGIQKKLTISTPDDPLEREADHIAEAVTTNDASSAVSKATAGPRHLLQRACACGGRGDGDCTCDEGSPLLRAATATQAAPRAPPSIASALSSAGEPLPASLRAEFEPRFGHDFSGVRVHKGALAARSASDVSALAYTVGQDMAFATGQYAPETAAGRRLIAHELAHVVQQSSGRLLLQRFVPCTRARLSLEECPRREPGEVKQSRTMPMIVEYINWPEKGYLVADFAVGQSRVKPSAFTHKNWPALVRDVSDTSTEWRIIGFADCQGDDALNLSLRKERADAVFGALPLPARERIVDSSAARLIDCITQNDTSIDRTFNRAALITREKLALTYEPKPIEGTRPVPRPVTQPTVDCSDNQKNELAAALPIAIAMVEKAMSLFSSRRRNPGVRDLLAKYFNDRDGNWRIYSGFKNTLYGLKTATTLECENKGDFAYDYFCKESVAYVRTLAAARVHLCDGAFGRGDIRLADTLVHEFSHMFDHTNLDFFGDEPYCDPDCRSLSRWDAYDNADSYSSFAAEAYVRL